ncbi:MAG: GH92 family glycosyl hydrolase [Bryobacteraceae bacterium]|jgi:predicted alpha-1,2-mannosidase
MRALVAASALGALSLLAGTSASPADSVDPLIGTAGDGQTFPAAGVPFGMTQWTPQTRAGEGKCVAPYYAKDTRIQGFRGSHFLSGSCVAEYGSFTVMPLAGPLKLAPAERASAFERSSERARPYRYDVTLADSHIRASIAGTARSGFLRFVFPAAAEAWILIEANARRGEGEIRIDAERREISGSNPVHRQYAGAGKPAGFSGYFVARFDRPFRTSGGWSGSEVHQGAVRQTGGGGPPGAYIGFVTAAGETVSVKIGTSFVSVEEARRNLDSEIPGWDFEAVAAAAFRAWNEALGKVEIQNASESRRRIFYTALYHSLLVPHTFSDVSGSYPGFAGEGRTEIARGFTYYCDFSLWDTFRALHPLLTILAPHRDSDMMQSLIAMGEQGGWLPVYPAWNSYTQEMIGDHAIAAIGDAYLKGIRGFDIGAAYRLMRRNATEQAPHDAYVDGRGRRALDSYLKYGFIPLEDPVRDAFHKGEQVSRTLEYAYDDFVLGEVAQALGKSADAALFHARARNYRNVIDRNVGFARGRHADGSWDEPFDPGKPYRYITEGLPFQFTFFVPQDMAGLIELLGGRDAVVHKLDELFAKGYYDHGNEPSHHIAYLYDFAGAPWKTQQRVHAVLEEQYTDKQAGLAGNDDCGQMSAWYAMSALGIYQVAPGIPVYELGTPAFDLAIVHTEGGHRFTLRAAGASEGKFYIQSATLNGKPLHHPWIAHQDIVSGGELVLKMGPAPNFAWGATPADAPPSMSSKP